MKPIIPLTQEEYLFLFHNERKKDAIKKLFSNKLNKRVEDFLENEK
jgi:hypothetical protein